MKLGQRKIHLWRASATRLHCTDRDWDAAERAAPLLSRKYSLDSGAFLNLAATFGWV